MVQCLNIQELKLIVLFVKAVPFGTVFVLIKIYD